MVALHETTDQGIAEICGSDRCGDRLISLILHSFSETQKDSFKSLFERVVKLFLGVVGMKRHCTSIGQVFKKIFVSLSYQVHWTFVLV